MNLKIDEILNDIYNKIFLKELDYSVNVFLCGADPAITDSLRHFIYKTIKDDSRYNVVFPEKLFSNLLVEKEYNLLKLENELANDVDAVVLPLEGLGTMAELGAFASFDKLSIKTIVINDKKYKSSRSFLTLGPVKLIASKVKDNVIYYERNFEKKIDPSELAELRKKVLSRIKALRKAESKHEIKNFFNLSRFILYIVAIFQPINEEKIKSLLEKLKKGIALHYVKPCLESLVEKQKIIPSITDFKKYYSLTPSGHFYIYENLLRRLNIIKVFSRIRARVINNNNRQQNKLNMEEELSKFLVM